MYEGSNMLEAFFVVVVAFFFSHKSQDLCFSLVAHTSWDPANFYAVALLSSITKQLLKPSG